MINSRDMRAMSRADIACVVDAVRPQQSSNFAVSIPSPFARSFIIATNASSLPPIYSAIATLASFPDAMTMHLISVSTVCTSPSSKNTWDPPIDFACALVVTSSCK